MARRPPPRAQSSGLPPAFFAVLVIFVAGAAVLYIGTKVHPTEDAPAEAEKKPSPFADIPDEEPPGGKGGAKPSPFADVEAEGGGAGGAASPFDDVVDPKTEQIWKDASALGQEGMDLAEKAAKAKDDGDRDTFKALGTEAKDKLNKALELTRDWETQLVGTLGANHPQVKAIERTRKIWRNRLVALVKTVGM